MAHVEEKQPCELFQKGRLECKPQFYPLTSYRNLGQLLFNHSESRFHYLQKLLFVCANRYTIFGTGLDMIYTQ